MDKSHPRHATTTKLICLAARPQFHRGEPRLQAGVEAGTAAAAAGPEGTTVLA